MSTKPIEIGPNRTGIAVSPKQSKEAVESARAGVPVESLDTTGHHAYVVDVARSSDPLGTLPPPASMKGVAKTGLEKLKGHQPAVFLDQLGERLAFERTGVRLYESLLVRFDAGHPHAGGPTRAELERIRDEELSHFQLLREAMEKLGGDPTAVTPSADVVGVAGSGLLQVLADPRATLTEGLKAVLIAELADNDGWVALINLAEGLGKDELAEAFKAALAEEDEHLASVRGWLETTLKGQIGLSPTASAGEPAQPGA